MEALYDSSLIEVRWLCRAWVVALTVDVNFLFNVSTALFGEVARRNKKYFLLENNCAEYTVNRCN